MTQFKLTRREPCMVCGLNKTKLTELVNKMAESSSLWAEPVDSIRTIGEEHALRALRCLSAAIENDWEAVEFYGDWEIKEE